MGFAAGFAFLAIVSTTSYLVIADFREAADLRQRSSLVLANLKDVLVRIDEAETGARGFVITGEEQYLQPYQEAVNEMRRELTEVSELLADSPVQAQRVDALRSKIDMRMERLAATIELRRRAGLEAAAGDVKTGIGRALMNEVRRIIDEIETEEEDLYGKRDALVQKHAFRAEVVVITAGLLALGIVGFSMLVTRYELRARYRAEETSRRLAAIVNSANDAILGKTLDGVITSWNRGAERLYGYTAEEIVGQPISRLVPPDHADELREILDALGRKQHVEHFETVRRHKDGSLRDVSVTISPIEDSAGRVVGASSIARDISDRKAVERLRADFVAMLTHDIKNPLAVIDGYLSMLRESAHLDSESDELLAGIEGSTQTILSLVANYLDMAKIEAGQMTLRKQPVAVASILKRVVEPFASAASRRRVTLAVQADDEMRMLEADPLALERVFANLVGNALKFSPEGGTVTLSVESRPQDIVIKVTDSGCGLAPDEIPFLFERYRQTEAGRAKKGAGMGLFIVKSLVEAHGGSVQVRSSPGQGACFEVVLPGPRP